MPGCESLPPALRPLRAGLGLALGIGLGLGLAGCGKAQPPAPAAGAATPVQPSTALATAPVEIPAGQRAAPEPYAADSVSSSVHAPDLAGSAPDGALAAAPSAPVAAEPTPVPKLTPVGTADPSGAADGPDPAAAVAVLEGYYAALDRRAYDTAYRLWENDGQASGQSPAAFRQGFARTAHTRVTVGAPGDSEGAAGSLYLTVPVTVDATLNDGTRQRFGGSYVLRRVNDVPGSSAAERRWHLHSAALKPG